MRLSYCYPEPDQIREGVRRLARVIEAELDLHSTFDRVDTGTFRAIAAPAGTRRRAHRRPGQQRQLRGRPMSETAAPAPARRDGDRAAPAARRRPGRRTDLRARGQPVLRHPGGGGAGARRSGRRAPRRRRRAAARPGRRTRRTRSSSPCTARRARTAPCGPSSTWPACPTSAPRPRPAGWPGTSPPRSPSSARPGCHDARLGRPAAQHLPGARRRRGAGPDGRPARACR